jgi:hypothetical protein
LAEKDYNILLTSGEDGYIRAWQLNMNNYFVSANKQQEDEKEEEGTEGFPLIKSNQLQFSMAWYEEFATF